MAVSSHRMAYRAAVALVSLDLVLIGLFGLIGICKRLSLIESMPVWLNIGNDRSVSEFFNSGKWLAITLLLLLLWHRTRMTTAAGFAVAFAVIAADDILLLHDRGGEFIAGHLNLEGFAGLIGQDLGELIVWSGLGLVVVSAVGLSYWAASTAGRRIGRTLLLFVGTLITFAVGIDMLHAALRWHPDAYHILGLIEDGGEMIVGSLCVAWCMAQTLGGSDSNISPNFST